MNKPDSQLIVDTLKKSAVKMIENRFKNLPVMDEGNPGQVLYHRHVKRPAVIVASGPSLDKNITLLTGLPKNTILIGVDSVAGPFTKMGIIPNYIASVDYHEDTFKKFTQQEDTIWYFTNHGVKLIFVPEVTPKIPNLPFKEKIYFYHGFAYKEVLDKILSVRAPAVPSIRCNAHLAVFAAQYMGCDPIIFVGHDFGFERGTNDHAEGCFGLQKEPHSKMTDKCLYLLEQYRIHEEKMISMVTEPRYIDATEGAGTIKGTRKMSLRDAINEIKNTPWGSLASGLSAFKREMASMKPRLSSYQTDYDPEKADALSKNPYIRMLSDLIVAKHGEKAIRLVDRIKQSTGEKQAAAVKAQNEFLAGACQEMINELLSIIGGS